MCESCVFAARQLRKVIIPPVIAGRYGRRAMQFNDL